MHFHLPKPLHGWREFAGEVGIIVVGVLIALGAEQVVEAMRWKERAGQAREALAGEISGHYGQAIEWRTVEPCVAAQLDRLEQRLLSAGDRVDPAPLFREGDRTFVLRAPSRPYPSSVWDGVLAEGVSSHLTADERLYLGVYYAQVHDLDEFNKQLTASGTRLNSLARPIALDASARLSLLQSIDEIRDINRWMGVIAGQLVGVLDYLHMRPPGQEMRAALGQSGTVAFCRAHRLPMRPLAEALKPLR